MVKNICQICLYEIERREPHTWCEEQMRLKVYCEYCKHEIEPGEMHSYCDDRLNDAEYDARIAAEEDAAWKWYRAKQAEEQQARYDSEICLCGHPHDFHHEGEYDCECGCPHFGADPVEWRVFDEGRLSDEGLMGFVIYE